MRSRNLSESSSRSNTHIIQALFKFTRDGFVLVDEQKQILAINPATEKIMGWKPSEVIGKKTCDLLFCCEDTRNCPIPSERYLTRDMAEITQSGRFHETSPLNKSCHRRKLWLSCSSLATSVKEPYRAMIIIRDITRIKKTEERLRELSSRDSLTRLYNHSYFIDQLTNEIHRSLRYLHPVSLLMIDVDDFKKYNDTFGHLKGDRLLVKIGKIIGDNVRSVDFVARYGGEEFAVIILETDKESAYLIAEKVRKEVRKRFRSGPTISIGVATCPEDARKVQSLIKKADHSLYVAKKSGKNLVKVFSS